LEDISSLEEVQRMISFYTDVINFWSEVTSFEKPDWCTPYTTIIDNPKFALIDFNSGNTKDNTPILIIPPQAGQHSCIADYDLPDQSLVNTCLNNSDSNVYAIEWKSCTHENKDQMIDDLVKTVTACVNKVGGRVHLIGLSQGGWLSAIFAALYPSKTESLMIGGSPIDTKAGGGAMQMLVQSTSMEAYEGIVASGGGMMSGDFMLSSWKMMNPFERFWKDCSSIYESMGDSKKIARIKRFRSWYEYTQNVSGGWYLQAIYELFKKNRLVRGKLKINEKYVKLDAINCPVALLAGERDEVALIPQTFNTANYISTEDDDVLKTVIPDCGHVGVFMGRKAQVAWAEAVKFCIERSGMRKLKKAA
jgi:poly(3-hydroxyalkanoate) synthetase